MARKWWTLIAVSVATFMLLLDITVVNVAFGFLAILVMLRTFRWREHVDRDQASIERA